MTNVAVDAGQFASEASLVPIMISTMGEAAVRADSITDVKEKRVVGGSRSQ